MRSLVARSADGIIAIVDQTVFAGGNFVVSVILARWMVPAEYGAFALGYSLLNLVALTQYATFAEPLLVYGGGKHSLRFPRYSSEVVWCTAGISILIALICGAITVLLSLGGLAAWARATLGLTLALPTLPVYWVFRRVPYVIGKPAWTLWVGIAGLLVTLLTLLALRSAGILNAASGLAAISAGSLAGIALLHRVFPVRVPRVHDLRSTMTEHWAYGRWSTLAAAAEWFPQHSYGVFLSPAIGLAFAGGMRVISSLAVGAQQVFVALSALLLPRMARAIAQGKLREARNILRKSLVLFVASSLIGATAFWMVGADIIVLLFGREYMNVVPAVPLIALMFVPMAVSSALRAYVRAAVMPQIVLLAYAVATALTASIGFFLAFRSGLFGAATGMVLGACASAACFLLAFRWLRNYTSPAASVIRSDDRATPSEKWKSVSDKAAGDAYSA